ncbi:MAG TPA: DUF4142 domain-containing protein [Sphingobium sp.]|nr:DUF4142 domain-containing protein [Sphingobium sp.]
MAAEYPIFKARVPGRGRPVLISILGALGLACAPAIALAQPLTAEAYVVKAGATDLFERQSAQLMRTSRNPEVAAFAEMMVRDHMKSTEMVTAAAREAKLKVTAPELTRKQTADLASLRAAEGAERDRLYIEQQKAAHQEALSVQSTYASEGGVAPLKAAAGKIVPVVKHHITLLDKMK